MKRWYKVLFLTGLVMAARGSNLAVAQAPEGAPAAGASEVKEVPLPGYVSLPAHMDLDAARHPYFNRKGYCCDSYPGSPGCSNMHETCRFILGSCRSFFGEPCPPKPAKYPLRGSRGGWR